MVEQECGPHGNSSWTSLQVQVLTEEGERLLSGTDAQVASYTFTNSLLSLLFSSAFLTW